MMFTSHMHTHAHALTHKLAFIGGYFQIILLSVVQWVNLRICLVWQSKEKLLTL